MAAQQITVQHRVKVAPKALVKHLLKALRPKSVQYAIDDAMSYGTDAERMRVGFALAGENGRSGSECHISVTHTHAHS